MAAGDPLNIGISGLLLSQRSLSVVSNNVSNVNTEGYSRQRPDIVNRDPTYTGGGYLGNGADVTNVRRVYDQFLNEQVARKTTDSEYQNTYYDYASQMDNLLADPEAGLNPAMEAFFNANQGVADDPASISARQVMLTEGESLMNRFHIMYSRMDDLDTKVNQEMSNIVNEINSLSAQIADLNEKIANSPGLVNNRFPNDLMDRRDVLVKNLSEYVDVRTVQQDNYSVNVYIGNGQSLVNEFDNSPIEIVPNRYDTSRNEIGYTIGNQTVNITNLLGGGQLGSLVDFRDEVLNPAINSMGRIAYSLESTYNAQHRLGTDLNSELGLDFFGTSQEPVKPDLNNDPAAPTVTYNIVDTNQLTNKDYILRANGAGTYDLLDQETGSVVQSAIDPANPQPQATVDGIEISIGAGAVVSGDSYLIQPTRAGARTIDITSDIDDPDKIAAASPVRTTNDLGNTGDAVLGEATINNTNGLPGDGEAFATPLQLNPPLEVQFSTDPLTPYDFEVRNANTGVVIADGRAVDGDAYDPATGLDVIDFLEADGAVSADYGYDVRIDGDPGLGDTFTIEYNQQGTSDNTNMLELAGLQTSKTMLGGDADYQEAYSGIVTDVGTRTHQADIAREAQDSLLRQAVSDRQAVSGVNLDEEAANMLKYQQSYQAAAQVISTAKSFFDELIAAVR